MKNRRTFLHHLMLLSFILIFSGASFVDANPVSAPTQKLIPVWRTLLLVYHTIDTDYTDANGVPRHLTLTLPQTEILDGMRSFRQYASIAYDFSNTEAFVQYDIVHVTRAINSLSSMGTNVWWVSPNDTRQELDQFAPQGTYDSVLVLWPQADLLTGQQIPSGGWGLAIPATSWSNGATYATVANAPHWLWDTATVGEPWLHEWLHGVCSFYAGKGYPMPIGDADGGGSHGYIWSSNTGWANYYRDLMRGRVLDSGSYKGVTSNAWRSGAILSHKNQVLADYFYADTTSSYQKTGTVVWLNTPSKEQSIKLGDAEASDNKMYIAANLEGNSTVTGRLFIPASGVGIWDTVAIALRNDQAEYWATLAYGTALAEKNHISIMRNDAWGPLYPLTLSSGWYTVRLSLDYQNHVMRMKTWADGGNEPGWQLARSLDANWTATQVGFRHYGQGTWVDDLVVMQEPSAVNAEFSIFLPLLQSD